MSVAVAPLPSTSPLQSPVSSSSGSGSSTPSPHSGSGIVKPLVVSAGGWRPRFMRGGAAPPTSLAVAPPAEAPTTVRATSLPSAKKTSTPTDDNDAPTDIPDRSHSATAPPPATAAATANDKENAVPLVRVTSLSSPSSTTSENSSCDGNTSCNTHSNSNHHTNDTFSMPMGSPTFYSQDSRPSPSYGNNTNNNSNNSNHLLLPRTSATFTKSPSRPHLLRSEANGNYSSSNNSNTSPTYGNGRHIDVSPSSSTMNTWNSPARGSNTDTMTPSHAAITAHGLRSVQLDFQLLRQMRSDGVNGAYQIADAAGNRVIFKPNDEESFDVRTVPVSDIPAQDLAAALPAIAKQAAAAGFRPSKQLMTLLNGGNSNTNGVMNQSNNSNSNNNSNNNSRRGGGSYIGQRHGRGLHHRRRPRRGRGKHQSSSSSSQQSSPATAYIPPHIDTDDESSPASPDSSRRPSTTTPFDSDEKHGYDDDESSSAGNDNGASESDVVLPSPPHNGALTSLSSATSDTLSIVNQYMTPYLAPGAAMRMFKNDHNPCGPGVPRGVAWVSGTNARDLMLNIKVSPRRGVAYGDTTHKEWAAYLLDHGRFSGVPRTITASVNMYQHGTLIHTGPGAASSPHGNGARTNTMMGPAPLKRLTSSAGEDKHGSPTFAPLTDSPPISPLDGHHGHGTIQTLQPEPRYGSLQEFKEHICSAEDMGNSQFAVDEVHKVGILDLRLVNLDRHLGNILVAKVPGVTTGRDQYKLIPIDHGYILPDYRDIADVNFEWLHWKQCKEPFSAASLAYIASLDPVHDATLLKDVGVRNGSIITCVIATIMLQRAAAAGLTLFAIAEMAQRGNDDTQKSILERIVAQTDEEMAATSYDDCHGGNGHHNNGHITTDDELDDDVIHAINNRGRGSASHRGRGSRGSSRGSHRSWGRAFTKTTRSAPLPTVASSPPSMDDEPTMIRTKSVTRASVHRNDNRRVSGMSLEEQMDDNVHYLGQPSHRPGHSRHSHNHDSSPRAADSPASSSHANRQSELASFAKKKNLLTSPMVNPMSTPSSVRPAPLLRHASDQVYQNGVGMTLMPDSESPALKPVDNDDGMMEDLSLDGVAARIGSPVTSPSKSRSLNHHHHYSQATGAGATHGFMPRSSRIAASNWSASASPSTSPPSVSLFNRANTSGATTQSALFSSMMATSSAAAPSLSSSNSNARNATTSGSATSSPGTSPPSMSPVGSPAFGSMPTPSTNTAGITNNKFKSSARARVTITDATKRHATTSSSSSGVTVTRSRPVPIRAAATRVIDSEPNSAAASPATPISPPSITIAASPPSPAAIPMRMPTPLQPSPSPSPPPMIDSSIDTLIFSTNVASPPVSPPQGTTTSTPTTPMSSSSSSAPSTTATTGATATVTRVSPTSISSRTNSNSTPSSSPTAVGTSASTASASTSSSTNSRNNSTRASSLHSTTSSPPSLSSWNATHIPSASVASHFTPAATDTLTLPHSAVPLKTSPSMELIRATPAGSNASSRNSKSTSSSSTGPGASTASSSSTDLPSEAVPPRRYAWNEVWLTRFMKVVTGAVDCEVGKLVAAASAAAANATRSDSCSSTTSAASEARSTSSASSTRSTSS